MKTEEEQAQEDLHNIVTFVLILGFVALCVVATIQKIQIGPKTSSEKAADSLVEQAKPKPPERICIQDDKYVISSKCPR